MSPSRCFQPHWLVGISIAICTAASGSFQNAVDSSEASEKWTLRPPSLGLEACTARCRASCSEWWSFFSCWFLWCNIQWPFCPVSGMWYWWLGHGNVWWIFLCLLPSSLTRHLSRGHFHTHDTQLINKPRYGPRRLLTQASDEAPLQW